MDGERKAAVSGSGGVAGAGAVLVSVVGQLTALVGQEADSDRDPAVTLLSMVLQLAPGAEFASLTGSSGRSVCRTIAATDDQARLADRVQYLARQGPGIEAMRAGRPVTAPDLTTDERWPRFTEGLLCRSPVVAVMSLPMGPHGAHATAVNLYSTTPTAFTPPDELHLALLNLALAGIAQQRRLHNVHRALTSNRRIGTAVGILMTHQHLTEQQAFDLLNTESRRLNRKIHDLADEVCHTGTLPDTH